MNTKALGFPEIMEGSGSGDGSKNILTYNVDSRDTIDYCHRSLQNDYYDEEDIPESANRYLSGMSYAKATSEFKMWEGWTSRLLEMTQLLTRMLPEDKA